MLEMVRSSTGHVENSTAVYIRKLDSVPRLVSPLPLQLHLHLGPKLGKSVEFRNSVL
jgi:hypothetical protein